MATTKPRIQVTLKPSQYDLLKRLAKVQKRREWPTRVTQWLQVQAQQRIGVMAQR